MAALDSVLNSPELDIRESFQNGYTTYYVKSTMQLIPNPRLHFLEFLRQSGDWGLLLSSPKPCTTAGTSDKRSAPTAARRHFCD
ncbi:hypothetical protein [Leptospira alexanderi]|uniref:hypothetical protein n=1 Tax=Leptospira alexanderi TaxID=100053 RepID=UPI001115A8C6|nr:hypothetical protein [Leptospira alexanderi]